MASRFILCLFLAAWVLPVFCLPASAQAPEVRSPEVIVPQAMMVPVPEHLRGQFPNGFLPGLGFGLNCAQAQADGSMVLNTLTGRGPTVKGPMVPGQGALAPSSVFILPGFTPSIATMKLTGNKAEVLGMLALKDEDGNPLRGIPPAPTVHGGQVELPLDLALKRLEFDKHGVDPQGVAYDAKRGVFWVADGYRPALLRVSPRDGRTLIALAPGSGLEDYLATRRAGWGFSGTSISPTGKVYTIMRGVLFVEEKPAIFSRIIEFDPDTERVRQLPYPIDDETFPDPAAVSTGEVVAFADKRLLVLEQGVDKSGKSRSLVFSVDLTQTHNINKVYNDARQPPEVLREKAQWRKQDLKLARKTMVLDLHAAGFTGAFAESMTLLSDGRTLAVMSGHGFGLEVPIADSSVRPDGKPVLDPTKYQLGADGRLLFEGQPSKAVLGIRPTREIPRLWVATLPKRAADY
jgi:hypothetical protein